MRKNSFGGDMLKLSYFELLSNGPVVLPGAGGILSPKLREIAALGIENYRQYLTVLSMDDFDLFLSMEPSALLLQRVLNFLYRKKSSALPGTTAFSLKPERKPRAP